MPDEVSKSPCSLRRRFWGEGTGASRLAGWGTDLGGGASLPIAAVTQRHGEGLVTYRHGEGLVSFLQSNVDMCCAPGRQVRQWTKDLLSVQHLT